MRLLICGSRGYNHFGNMTTALELVTKEVGMPHTIIHGASWGADALASRWAYVHKVDVEAYGAKWGTKGRSAGPVRNTLMLLEGQPDYVAAFVSWGQLKSSRGTSHMVKLAWKSPNVGKVWVFDHAGKLMPE